MNLSPEIYQTPIERLELSHRTLNCLKRAHITRVGEVLQMSDEELLKIRNFGEKSLSELRSRLADQGVASGLSADAGLDVAPAADADDGAELEGISVIPAAQGVENLLNALNGMGDDGDNEDFDDDLDYDFEDDEEDC